jgi:hypothetical protein
MEIQSGEMFQLACDYWIGTRGDIEYNPRIRHETATNPERWIDLLVGLDAPIAPNRPLRLFCYTHVLQSHLGHLMSVLRQIHGPFSLYFHNSDDAFCRSHYLELATLPNLTTIHSQNNTVPEVVPLPIGLANSQWGHGKREVLQSVMDSPPTRDLGVYFHFNVDTNREKRARCKTILTQKGLSWSPAMAFEEYIPFLARHRYCITPDGNGLDTHRFWECVYLGVVPIVVKSELIRPSGIEYVQLDSWDDLDVHAMRGLALETDFQSA